MAEITRIGAIPGFVNGIAAYNAGFGTYIGGPSGTQLDVPDIARVGSGYLAGEALLPGDAVFLFNNRVYACLADGATATYAGVVATALQRVACEGFASEQAQPGEAVTIWGRSVELTYTTTVASGTVAKDYFISTTVKGGLADTAATITTVVQPSVARYLGDGRIRIRA